MRFAVCRCLRWLVRSSSKIRSMIPVNGPQLWPPRRRASAIPWRHRERQHLTDRLAVYTKHPRGLAGAHPLDMTRPPNPCVQLHPIHPPRLPVRATLTEGYTRSHFGPPQPDRPAASVGDYCSAVLTPDRALAITHAVGIQNRCVRSAVRHHSSLTNWRSIVAAGHLMTARQRAKLPPQRGHAEPH